MVKIDLKDTYFRVPIFKGHQTFLGFPWKGTYREFACLPFGIASAPRVFPKIVKPVIGLLRKQGIRLINYLNDFFNGLHRRNSTFIILCHLGGYPSRNVRICGELPKMPTTSYTVNTVSGFPYKFNYAKDQPSTRQSKKCQKRVSHKRASSAPTPVIQTDDTIIANNTLLRTTRSLQDGWLNHTQGNERNRVIRTRGQ